SNEQLTTVVGGAAAAPSEAAAALSAEPEKAALCMQGAFKAGFDAARANPNAQLDLNAVFPAHPNQIVGGVAGGAAAGACLERMQPAALTADCGARPSRARRSHYDRCAACRGRRR